MTHEDEDIKLLLTEAVPPLASPPDRVGAVARRVRRHRQRLIGTSALAMAMTVALGVAGVQILTGGNHAPPSQTADDSGGQGRWTSCADAAPEMATPGFRITAEDVVVLPRLDGDFTPTAVVICGHETQRRADGGEDIVATERRADDVAALVTALRLPDESSTNRGGCFMMLALAPWLAVVDADGRWMRPGIPLDSCRKPRPEVREALDALPLTTVATRPIAEVESAEAATAGCSQRWKDMLSVETTRKPGPRTGALPELFPAAQQIRLCVYQVPKSAEGSDGEFAHGTVLPADRRAAIEHALDAAGPAESCNGHASRFALLWSVAGGDPQTYVELDGCHRIMVVAASDGPVLAQGDAALAELIDKP
ncbi:hypothetical protein GA0070607_3989 [Micromonospora coriariae]|uniref:Uncharacterized protein n=1 Tax=Micromonospora coriariae TaxID=285665 RepID=A0A1C4WQM8_9ACTN|nr:hypothetical protein [Micromonospora coriariae]SCE98453.1 hypothetical protein GA0070607_3989 [Micromonospora coriariae]